MTDLLSLNTIGAIGLAAILCVGTWWVRGWVQPKTNTHVQTDTVWTERTITKRDTVTEVRPRTRRIYDTVRVTDTFRVPVPQEMSYGTISIVRPNPLQLTGDQATLTRYDVSRQQYVQDVYDIPTASWALTAHGTGAVGQKLVTGTTALHVEKRTDWGAVGVGPTVMGAVTNDGYIGDYGISLSIRTTLWSR